MVEATVGAIERLTDEQVIRIALAEDGQLKSYAYYSGVAAAANDGVMTSDLWRQATEVAHRRAAAIDQWPGLDRGEWGRSFLCAARWALVAREATRLPDDAREALAAAWRRGTECPCPR